MLVPAAKLAEVEAIAQRVTAEVVVGDPASEATNVGPLVSKVQFDRVERYIEKGIAEGAKLVAGGAGRPEGLSKGYYVKPTIFSNVRNDMTIAREEIFGPVLCILPYESEEQAIADRERYAVRARRLCLVEGQSARGAWAPASAPARSH